MNFDYFQIEKWMSQTVRVQKEDKKIMVICLVFIFPSSSVVFKSSETLPFLMLYVVFSKNLSML